MSRSLAVIILLALAPLLGQCSHEPDDGTEGPWRHRMYTATYFTKLADTYFVMDTWHHRVLYSNIPYQDLTRWNTLTESIGGPHSIATDGEIVVYDDTGHGNLRAARYFNLDTYALDPEGHAEEYEMIFDVGIRPHRVLYDEEMASFYAIASGSQEIIRVTNERGLLVVQDHQTLDFLGKAYTRSMSIIDDHMFFVTRSHGIIETTYLFDSYEVVQIYDMPHLLDDLNDIFRSEAGWYYISATPKGFVRTRSLDDLVAGNYEDLYDVLGLVGTPYYMSEFDGLIALPLITEHNGIITFKDAETGPVYDIQVRYDFGPPEPADDWRKGLYPR